MPNEEKLKKLLSDLKRLKAKQEGGINAELLYDLLNKIEEIKELKIDMPIFNNDLFHDLSNNLKSVKELEERFERVTKEIKDSIPDLNFVLKAIKGKDGYMPIKGKDYFTDNDIKMIIDEATRIIQSQIRIPDDGKTPVKGIDYFDGASGSPDTPEVIISKLESIEENEDKLKISAIGKLQEKLDELEKKIKTGERITYVGGAGATGGHVVKAYDLSDSLDGSTKTFSLPAFWRIISVVSSSFPTAFRLTTDYTVDGSLFKITFTSAIDAGTTLASGQTIIITYSE